LLLRGPGCSFRRLKRRDTAARSFVGPFRRSSGVYDGSAGGRDRPAEQTYLILCATFFIINETASTMANDIQETVTSIIVEKLGVDESDVTPDASITNDLGADSLDTVELIMEFEKEFDLTIPDEEAEEIATVGDAIDYLEEKVE